MDLIKEIKDVDLSETFNFKTRNAARAILYDSDNLIPILFVSKYNYHKLPGGGIDEGENIKEALKREALEEVGCEIEIQNEIGKIIGYRKKHQLKQTSFCYIGKILSKGKPNFTQKEINNGFQIIWLTLDNAINKLKLDKPDNYEGLIIQERDLTFLEKAKSSNFI